MPMITIKINGVVVTMPQSAKINSVYHCGNCREIVGIEIDARSHSNADGN